MKSFSLFNFLLLAVFITCKKISDFHQRKTSTFSTRRDNSHFNASTLLNTLLLEYDNRLRPQFGGMPLDVSMELIIASFDSISEVNMDFTITVFLNQYWRDERLKFGRAEDSMTLMSDFAEQIWVPDTFIANDKFAFLHDVTEKNKMIKLWGDGKIMYGLRFTTTLSCMMDLKHYPLDQQNCTVEIESYGYTNSEVNIQWLGEESGVKGVDKIMFSQFRIASYKTSTYIEVETTGAYVRLSLSFLFQRYIGYFIFQTYMPSILIVMLSWISFWINHQATSARVALGITTVLTMTTISTGVRASLPRISYIKAIDIYLVTCFVFVFAALLEYAAVNYMYWNFKAKKRKQNNKLETNVELDFNINESKVSMAQNSTENIELEMIENAHMSPLPWLISKKMSVHSLSSFGSVTNLSMRKGSVARLSFRNNIDERKAGIIVRSNKHTRSGCMNRGCLSRARVTSANLKNEILNNVNVIDLYSRLVFPVFFLVFNLVYWCYYIYYAYFIG